MNMIHMDMEERPLVFGLNGKRVELKHVDPTMTLLTYLRTQTEFRGTKLACGEGGCGACVVVLARYDLKTGRIEERTINSCLALLCSIDRCAVTTIEGIGSSKSGQFHAVQERFAGFHASQCGFCTPGMCMSVYGALREKNGELNSAELEKSIQGNICRCTGYRPIIDVCKSFAKDVDLEDLGLNTFWKDKKDASLKLLPRYDPEKDPKFPQFLIEEIHKQERHPHVVHNSLSDKKYLQVSSFNHVLHLLGKFENKNEVKLVVGNTSAGIYKDEESGYKNFINISGIPELQEIKENRDGIEVGAAVSISKFIRILEDARDRGRTYIGIAEHLKKLASNHVRNAGSIGGNLVMAQRFGFDSDLATVLLGAGASVKIVSSDVETLQTVEDFLERPCSSPFVLKSVWLPSFQETTQEEVKFQTFRASPRPLGNAVAYVNAAFLIRFSVVPSSGSPRRSFRIEDSRLAFGVLGDKHAIRAAGVEELLRGKIITREVLREAIELLKAFFAPKAKNKRKSEYRVALAAGFLFKFLRFCVEDDDLDGVCLLDPEKSRSFISSRQRFHQDDQRHALGQPAAKVLAELQASGEAVYVDDIPSPSNCLHAAFVYSSKALARVKAIHVENALASPGAVSFFSVKDIPANGANLGVKCDLANESLFAEDIVECVGRAIGVMVAETSKDANAAAKKVEVEYDTQGLGPPILTVEDAVSGNSLFPLMGRELQTFGDVSEGFAKADYKIENAEIRTPSQYYFYMETNTVLVVPDENNCLVVYSSCQSTEAVQETISACVGIPMHNVRVITRRLGGGFGGKALKACLVAAACALAAYNLQRPVRMYLDRNTDMIMMGGREPMKVVYSVGFTSDGRITALQAQILIQAGWSLDCSWLIPAIVMGQLKKINLGTYSVDIKLCKTNIPCRSAMRAPGEVEGSFISDAILEHVASFLRVEAQKVMEINMHTLESSEAFYGEHAVGGKTGFTLPMLWNKLKETAQFEERLESVRRFNSSNKWLKRGLAIVQCSYPTIVYNKPARVSIFKDNSVVVEVGGIEMGQGLYTKVRQAAAYALSELFTEEEAIKIPMLKFRVVQADSISVPNGGWTAGSTGSEASCEAVRMACGILVERLKPIKRRIQEGQQSLSWESIVTAAKVGAVDLSAQAYFVPSSEASYYFNYGAGASEVEIDVLTGETRLLRTDMVYDCGRSMNPAVDVGQIEGAFAQGVGFFLTEEYIIDSDGKLFSDGTWTYKPPTFDNLPQIFNIELYNSPAHRHRILSSKASGEPPLLLASSVHGAIRHAVAAARADVGLDRCFNLDVPAAPDKVRAACGLENIEHYLRS